MPKMPPFYADTSLSIVTSTLIYAINTRPPDDLPLTSIRNITDMLERAWPKSADDWLPPSILEAHIAI